MICREWIALIGTLSQYWSTRSKAAKRIRTFLPWFRSYTNRIRFIKLGFKAISIIKFGFEAFVVYLWRVCIIRDRFNVFTASFSSICLSWGWCCILPLNTLHFDGTFTIPTGRRVLTRSSYVIHNFGTLLGVDGTRR
jgi:hypothetical protein